MTEFPNAKIILDRSKATREEWLALHDQHLGASDAGGVMGQSKYQTPLSTYVIKKGLQSHKEENEYTRWGKILEDVIRREFVQDFMKQEDKQIFVHEAPYMYESLIHPFMCVDLDGFISIEDPKQPGLQFGLLEIKRTTGRQKKYWKDDQVPDVFYTQVQHGMYILDLPFALVVCLMDSNLFWRYVPRKEIFIREMVKIEKRFWEEFILKNQMPGPSGEDVDTDLLLELYPKAEDVTVDLGASGEVSRYLELSEEIKVKKAEQELTKQKIIQLMGVAHRASAGEHKVTRVTFERPTFNLSGFKRDHPILAEKYTRSIPVDFPRIS